MRKVFGLLFTAGLLGCSSAPPPGAQVALRGPSSTVAPPAGFTHCECDVTCTATGAGFVGLSSFGPDQACAKGRLLCAQAGCTTCVQSGPASCE
jgi:hypothetical protein